MIERWLLEAHHALRRLRRRPSYTVFTVLTLALGVGGLAAISGIVQALLVDPLPYPHAEQLARMWRPGDWRGREIAALRGQWSDFTAVAAFRPKDLTLVREGEPTRLIPGVAGTSELFSVLQVRPLLGRAFAKGEDAPGAAPEAVLGNALWRELGGDPRIVGSLVELDGIEHTVIGVMPKGFWFPDPTIRVWVNDTINATSQVGLYSLIGRVAPGRDVNRMQPALDRATRILGERFTYEPQWDMTKNAALTPFRDWMVGPLRPALLATLAGMVAILLIACANVSALVLGQVQARAPELAVRAALGADRARLTAQIVIEVLLLGAAAAALGSVFGALGFDVLRGALPLGVWTDRASLDWTLLAGAALAAVVSALGIAIFPSFALWRGDLRLALAGARAGGVVRTRGRLQGLLIVGEVALAVVLACGAGLLARSVAKLYDIRPGFDTRGVAALDIAAPTGVSPSERQAMIGRLLERLAARPGVRSAAVTQWHPLRGRDFTMGLRIPAADQDAPTPFFRMVSPDFFATLGIPLRRGRVFNGSDQPRDSIKSIVVNEMLARLYFPGVDPIGQIVRGGFGGQERIVGVVADAAEGNLTDRPTPTRYYLYTQVPFVPAPQTLLVRTSNPDDAERLLRDLRLTATNALPSVAVQEATTMTRILARAVGPARNVMTLLGVLTLLALVLSAVGVYGVVSQFVAQRARDWSLRVALGLTPLRAAGLIVRHGAGFVAAGIVIGTAAALLSARALASLLYGVTTGDPPTMLAAVACLLLVGLGASLPPAIRAARSDPARVLRDE